MDFNSSERSVLAALADVLIPADESFPSASAVGVAGEGLDQILAARPDLGDGLKKILTQAQNREPAEIISDLQAKDPAAFGILAEIIPGAYFLNPQVRAALGYDGQSPHPIDPKPDYLDDGLLQSVIDRGAIYRPTPQ